MSGRGKGKSHAFTGDFIALGSKGGSSKSSAPPPSSSHSASSLPPTKKVKTMKTGAGGGGVVGGDRSGSGYTWESIAEEVDIVDLVSIIEHSYSNGDTDRPEKLICGTVKTLRSSRAKPDTVVWMSLIHLAKTLPTMFSASDYIRDAFCSLLKRDMRESFKSKGNCLVSVLAANVLHTPFQVRIMFSVAIAT